jgi:hypothetical protein
MRRSAGELSRLLKAFEVQHQQAQQSLQAIDAEIVLAKTELAETLAAATSDSGLGQLIAVHAIRKLSALGNRLRELDAHREQQMRRVVASDVRVRRVRDMMRKARSLAQSAELEKSIMELVELRAVRGQSSLT